MPFDFLGLLHIADAACEAKKDPDGSLKGLIILILSVSLIVFLVLAGVYYVQNYVVASPVP